MDKEFPKGFVEGVQDILKLCAEKKTNNCDLKESITMLMIQDGIEVYCLPDGACCEVDENHRSPLDLDDCPLGYETCNGNCFYYAE